MNGSDDPSQPPPPPNVTGVRDDNILAQRFASQVGPLFHYCSATSFLAILQNRTIRFSDASQLNDGEEVVWPNDLFSQAITLIRAGEGGVQASLITNAFLDLIEQRWAASLQTSRHFVACFSRMGDSLSQWRAYADDATGLAIGFTGLETFPSQLIEVCYDYTLQLKEMIECICYLFTKSLTPNYSSSQFTWDVIGFVSRSIGYKNPAFYEEHEVRLSRIVGSFNFATSVHQFDNAELSRKDFKVSYREARGRLVPYSDIRFDTDTAMRVSEITIGPRSQVTSQELELFLGSYGYSGVKIQSAGTRYR